MSDIKAELDSLLAAASAPNGTAPVANPPAPPIADPLRKVVSRSDFEKALAEAKGAVAVLFTQEGCGYCEDDRKALTELATKCGASGLTALEVDAEANQELSDLADLFKVKGTPTVLFAEAPESFKPKVVKEVEVERIAKKLKCARTPK